MAAEAQALQEGADESFAIQGFMREILGNGAKLPITIRTDNNSLYDSVHSTNSLEDKRLQMDIAILREMLGKGEIDKVEWIPKEQQLADCLTKKGALSKKLLQALNGNWKM